MSSDSNFLDQKWYTPNEVATAFQVTPSTVREWIRTGELKAIRLGKSRWWRISEEALRDFTNAKFGAGDGE